MRDSGWQMITERDKAHRALNQESGWSEPDGTFGIGCKSCVDEEYKRRYDEIEDRFRGTYDSNLPAFYNWCRSQEITIFELLFFDNIYDEHLREIAKISGSREDWQLKPIMLKGSLFVKNLKTDHLIGEIRKRIDMEIAHHHYANVRCRKFFGIRPWDICRQKAIFDYGKEWKAALNNAFENLSAS